jgi:putative hydrolase of the HAD superfamily
VSGLALWDFDGTLALRGGEVGWSRLLVEVLDEHDTGHRLDAEAFRPHLRNGFPWHTPNVPHQHLSSPEQWWGVVQPLLATAYERVGYSAESGRELAAHARRIYVDPSRGWLVFEDVTPVLTQLAERGWRHGIVSNHVPELRSIVVGLGLGDFFEFVHTSAETGYEKPHPEAFAIALRGGGARHAWMIGDNYTADVAGAEAVGLRAVLVRREHPNAERFSADLFGIEHFLEER